MQSAWQRARGSAIRLALFALVCALLLAATEALTRDTLRANAEASQQVVTCSKISAKHRPDHQCAANCQTARPPPPLVGRARVGGAPRLRRKRR